MSISQTLNPKPRRLNLKLDQIIISHNNRKWRKKKVVIGLIGIRGLFFLDVLPLGVVFFFGLPTWNGLMVRPYQPNQHRMRWWDWTVLRTLFNYTQIPDIHNQDWSETSRWAQCWPSNNPVFTLTLHYADLPGLTLDTLLCSHYSRF